MAEGAPEHMGAERAGEHGVERIPSSGPRVLALALILMTASQASAQIPVVIFGRVHDAVSVAPVVGALVVSEDGISAARADSLGNFALELQGMGPYTVYAVQDGYGPRRSCSAALLGRRSPFCCFVLRSRFRTC